MFHYKKRIIFGRLLLLFSLIFGLFLLSFTSSLKEKKIEPKSYLDDKEFSDSDKELTDEELKLRIGQMLMFGFRGTEVKKNSKIVKAIENLGLGGVILFDFDVPSKSFPRNILNHEQTKKLIFDLQSYSKIPLFVAVDAEGGKINRLKPEYGFLDVPSHRELGIKNDPEFTKSMALKLAQQLKDLGFNLNFAPVVDLNLNPKNPIIGKLGRSFSSDPEKVSLQAEAFIKSQDQHNIISVVKHFPGHGSSFQDSHLGMVDVTNTYQEKELIPYKKLEAKGLLKIVIVGHIFNEKIDKNYPATLSSKFLNDILRKEIGFDGLIFSDDLQMGAIVKHFGIEDSTIRAINAGIDVLLFSNNTPSGYDEELPFKIHEIIFQAVKDGKIPPKRIIQASNRIFEIKKSFFNTQ